MKSAARSISIGFYSPYIPKHFGGGERHLFTIAAILSRFYRVVVGICSQKKLTDEEIANIRLAYERQFGLDLAGVEFQASPFGTKAFPFSKLLWTKQFDKLFSVSDGSLSFSWAKQNILHLQIPFNNSQSGIINRWKLSNWKLNANSLFTKNVIERKWQTHVDSVLYPSVDIHQIQPGKKHKIILNIGRFFRQLHAKRQDVLIDAFKTLHKKYAKEMKGWKLVLIGGIEDQQYVDQLQTQAKDLPIQFIHEARHTEVIEYLQKATIYWHATGFEVDEFIHPERVEHFGITTVEAMAAGCIPMVINKGGQKEIVEHGVSGFLWNELDALIEKTLAVVHKEINLSEIAENARQRAEDFDQSHFVPEVFNLFELAVPKASQVNDDTVSVVIPTFNGKELLEKHLPAVEQCLRDEDEIVIVDDASDDNTVLFLKKKYGLKEEKDRVSFDEVLYRGKSSQSKKNLHIQVIVNKKNLRFAGAVNKGFEFATHDLVFLLNNDVSPRANVLSELLPYFTFHPERMDKRKPLPSPEEVFGVSPAELEGDKVVAGKNTLWFGRGLFNHSKATPMTTGETAWLSGGSALISKAKWQELGGLDMEYYPAYWEDIDISFRARQKGWRSYFEADAKVEHHHETTNRDALGRQKMQLLSMKNSFVFLRKHANVKQKMFFVLWLPYHLVVTNVKSEGLFIRGIGEYLKRRWQ